MSVFKGWVHQKKLHFLLTSLGSVVVNISGASEQKQLKQTGKQHSPDHKIISNKSYLHPWRAVEFVHHLTSSSWAAAVKFLALAWKLKVFSNQSGISGASGDLDYIKQAVWSHFVLLVLKRVPVDFSWLGERWNVVFCCETRKHPPTWLPIGMRLTQLT